MQTVFEYIISNYTWIIAGSIIILLAIIGYYADTTNFGQGKSKENENEDNVDVNSLEGKRMGDFLEHNGEISNDISEINKNNNSPISSNVPDNGLVNNVKVSQKLENINISKINSQIDSLNKSEQNFEKFDKEFNDLLPKKEIIDGELLDEINDLSLDKTQRINISDIPDVDDVELPDIKTLPLEDEDIWKF